LWIEKYYALGFSSRSTNSVSSLINFYDKVTKGTLHVVSFVLFSKEKGKWGLNERKRELNSTHLLKKSCQRAEKRGKA